MADDTKYARGLECTCSQLPHVSSCPVAPYFDDDDKISLDSEQGDYHDTAPFILECPRGCRFHQFEHAAGYDYSPTDGRTDQGDIPIVCPKCAWSDKQTLPAIVGFDPNAENDDRPFKILCPDTMCGGEWTREDGVVQVWLERNVLMGVEEAHVRGILFRKGQVVDEFTELSVECYDCNHQCGETDD